MRDETVAVASYLVERSDRPSTRPGSSGAHAASDAQPLKTQVADYANVPGATAEKGNIGVYQDAIGTVTPGYTSTITSQVSGIITLLAGNAIRLNGEKLAEIAEGWGD